MEYGFYEETVNGVLLIKNVLETLRSLFLFSSKVFLVLSLCGVRRKFHQAGRSRLSNGKRRVLRARGPGFWAVTQAKRP